MLKKLLAPKAVPNSVSVAILIIRLVMGLAFMLHGWGKIQSPFSWMPPGAPVPGFLQFLAAISEFGGGLALILGLLTRLGMLGLTITMLVAVSMHAFFFHDPFVNMSGQPNAFELPATYFTLALFFLINGPGKYSLDKMIFGER